MIALVLVVLLDVAGTLEDYAQTWAEHMASSDTWQHSPNLHELVTDYGGPCESAGENLYRGSDPANRWALYADSPTHAAVLAHPWDLHAVGHAVSQSGVHYVADVYCDVAQVSEEVSVRTRTQPARPTSAAPTSPTPPPDPIGSPPPFCPTTTEELCIQ